MTRMNRTLTAIKTAWRDWSKRQPLQRGAHAERAALAHLRAHGLKLIAHNYRCAAGELDLIMLDARELIFVEVRYRKSENYGGALASVDGEKQRKLRNASAHFLQQASAFDKSFDGCRFDVVAVGGNAPHYQFEWVRDAFADE